MSDIYKLILSKESIFESINLTTFTATGVVGSFSCKYSKLIL